ncbi:iron-sulfur cluster-binding protein [Desulfolutivibrio sulfoxidireducens]|uniref:iron-sulfur cluster-binding protein n=1 Tax=Desulfolutivibrio sulfoxidireducens TaxID=2773299 RepID=UPI00159DF2A2|nr:iron-sulfur cluster-binding protein [Desulfolutivibrio sulfoxidireducens]QLA14853.1 iron-sulfur cluster-binding protein [Desulfolutivibrio sulfoxidireducens]QLA18424.1 iron-sulfur cluster-binding protein [Desulfolutivibrio sulfoxidireducens]
MDSRPVSPWMKRAFAVTVFGLGLTGVAQMPIFSRYYIADVPGFGWLGDFVFTHMLHYALAAVFLFLGAYLAASRFLTWRSGHPLTGSGMVRVALYAGLVATGAVRMIKNLQSVYMGEVTVMLVDWSHLFLAVVLLGVVLWARWSGRRPYTE